MDEQSIDEMVSRLVRISGDYDLDEYLSHLDETEQADFWQCQENSALLDQQEASTEIDQQHRWHF